MKPLPLPSFTDEDMAIWLDRCARREMRWGMWLNERAVESDRRDAELMLRAQMHVNRGWTYIRLDNWNAATWDVEPAVVALPGWYLIRKGVLRMKGSKSMDIKHGPSGVTVQAIMEEVSRARLKFPGNDVMLAALSEEHGELANALLELRFATIAKQPKYDLDRLRDNVQKEAIQVAAVAIRILEDGDSSFPEYVPIGRG
jgi:NTP pyrophosphatase (non-canonical NTP hydrolase)